MDLTDFHGIALDRSTQSEPCIAGQSETIADATARWYSQAPRDKSGTRRPLEPSLRKGMPLGSNSSLTSVDIVCWIWEVRGMQ